MKFRIGKMTLTFFIGFFVLSLAITYGIGSMIFIMFPNVFEPFVANYPIFSHFGKLFIGWIVCAMLSKFSGK